MGDFSKGLTAAEDSLQRVSGSVYKRVHSWPSCFGLFPTPPEMFGFASSHYSFADAEHAKTLNSTTISLHYVHREPLIQSASTVTLLFVHGWPDSWRSWQRVLPLLDPGLRIVAMDQRGFGNSSKPCCSQAEYTTTTFANDIHRLIVNLKLTNVVLVGHSMGSFNVWLAAALFPNDIHGLVTIGSAAIVKGNAHVQLPAILKSTKEGGTNTNVAMPTFPYKDALVFQSSTIYNHSNCPTWMLQTVVHESMQVPKQVAKMAFTALCTANHTVLLERISQHQIPTLLLWGEHDAFFPPASDGTNMLRLLRRGGGCNNGRSGREGKRKRSSKSKSKFDMGGNSNSYQILGSTASSPYYCRDGIKMRVIGGGKVMQIQSYENHPSYDFLLCYFTAGHSAQWEQPVRHT